MLDEKVQPTDKQNLPMIESMKPLEKRSGQAGQTAHPTSHKTTPAWEGAMIVRELLVKTAPKLLSLHRIVLYGLAEILRDTVSRNIYRIANTATTIATD